MTRTRHVLFAVLALATAAFGQDTSFPPAGSPLGSTFDERAPANERIGRVVVNSGTFLDGLRLRYESRGGVFTTQSPQIGNTTGTSSTFLVPTDDWLTRVEVWYEAFHGSIRGLALQTHQGHRQEFGLPIGTLTTFQAVASAEIVGVHGTSGALMNSLGVITRPVLAGHTVFGSGCNSGLGTMQVRWRAGQNSLRLNTLAVAEGTNVLGSAGLIALGIGGNTAIPLDALGAPGCSSYTTLDDLIVGIVDPGNILGMTLFVPNNPLLVGARVDFQFASLNAPNALGLATSNVMRAQVGSL